VSALGELAEVPMMAAMFWHARRHQGGLEALRLVRGGAVDAQSVDDLDVVIEELDRLSRISDRLLILATAEHRGFARSPIDLAQVVETTARRWPPTADRDWHVEIVTGGTVPGDAERLSAALDAMIENAVKATVPGDRIAVVLRAEGDEAVLEVVDSGIGIADAHLHRVFDRFWSTPQAGRSGGRGGGGTGLGAGCGQGDRRSARRVGAGAVDAGGRGDGADAPRRVRAGGVDAGAGRGTAARVGGRRARRAAQRTTGPRPGSGHGRAVARTIGEPA
jgi:hypothetical protein